MNNYEEFLKQKQKTFIESIIPDQNNILNVKKVLA